VKLDLFASMLDLRPGMRLLDVGSGWGGPLVYLCKRYGVVGHGLTLSERQLAYARAWAEREGVACTFALAHWDRFAPDAPFDAVMTDEVIVHFFRLQDFFAKAFGFLRDGGVMVNKELHYGHPALGHHLPEGARFIDRLYGGTANYRSLAEELAMAHAAGFVLEEVRQLEASDYFVTAGAWRLNLRRHQAELEALVGKEVLRKYLVYLHLVMTLFAERTAASPYRRQEIHVVKCRKLPAALRESWGMT
jgi:cyclopropane-fatty-acyl-phospholipid synthase